MANDRDYTPDEIMDAISAALKNGNLEATASLMHLLALVDPGAAQAIHDFVEEVSSAV